MSYEYNTFIVVQHGESGRVFWAQNSGCSCPTPFEDFFFNGPDNTNMEELQMHNFPAFEAEVKSFAESSIQQYERDVLLDKAKKALKKAGAGDVKAGGARE